MLKHRFQMTHLWELTMIDEMKAKYIEYNRFKYTVFLTYFWVQKQSNAPCNGARIRLILQRRYQNSSKPALRCFVCCKYCSLFAENDINWLVKVSLICVVGWITWLTFFISMQFQTLFLLSTALSIRNHVYNAMRQHCIIILPFVDWKLDQCKRQPVQFCIFVVRKE